jgi:N-acetylmuramoyl-L-alanine amidase-like protein
MRPAPSRRAFLVASAGGFLALASGVGRRALAQTTASPRAAEVHGPLSGSEIRELPLQARDVAVHWAGNPNAQVQIALSTDGVGFGPLMDVGRDEVGEQRRNGETYGAVLGADGARFARVTSDRPIARLSVLALDPQPAGSGVAVAGPGAAAVAMPSVISRSGWGADESLRFANGAEVWPPEFYALQKCVVHHTATRNADPDPAATVRSIYYYHCITQGWGDIGYTFLIDEAGRIYKGRNSHAPGDPLGDTITGENDAGAVVTAGHALGVNQGSIGVAFLGTLTSVDATAAAKSSLVNLLAWDCDRHGIDPRATTLYQDPDGITSSYTPTQPIPNILGHRDVNATECPGNTFYPNLPSVRDAVASQITSGSDTTAPTAPALNAIVWAKNRFALSWSASSDTGSGVAGYEVYRATAAGGPFALVATTTQTSYNDSNLDKRVKTYWYFVKAFDRVGNRSAPSNTAAGTRR